MRRNIERVLKHFEQGRAHTERTCSTDGQIVYSYRLPIAFRDRDGSVSVLDPSRSPSRTTSSQISAVREWFPDAEPVAGVRVVYPVVYHVLGIDQFDREGRPLVA